LQTFKSVGFVAKITPNVTRLRSQMAGADRKRAPSLPGSPLLAVASNAHDDVPARKYNKLKFRVDQTINLRRNNLYKSMDQQPTSTRRSWVNPAFGLDSMKPTPTLQHIRTAIIQPEQLPPHLVIPIHRRVGNTDPYKFEGESKQVFPTLTLTPCNKPFPR
jgi:hypothetical protein